MPEPPRQISEEQIKPTDWINELVPSTDELPTMADMLPEPSKPDAEFADKDMEMPSSVMDLLFGETGNLESNESVEIEPEQPTVPSMAIDATPAVEETFPAEKPAEEMADAIESAPPVQN